MKYRPTDNFTVSIVMIIFVVVITMSFSGCSTLTRAVASDPEQAFQVAREAAIVVRTGELNDLKFTMAITKACSLTAVRAAERTLNGEQNISLQLFCHEMRSNR
ncbi:MAG: hypothetical protein JKY62_16915 [Desulfocapsa sp.]|nr:hypothetical protein [Desulfocapsa sp.]